MSNDTTVTNAYISTQEAAEILGVSTSTMKNWRTRKLFGCPFFSADKKFGNDWYYLRERVEQLKEVYQKGILQSMYKLARKFSDNFQKSDSSDQKGLPKFYDSEKVAKILGVTPQTVEYWRRAKIFQEDILTHDGIYLYAEESVADFQMEREKQKDVRTFSALQNVNDFSVDDLRDQLKKIPYAVLTAHGVLKNSPDGNFVCPACGNGSGENGTGIQEHIESNGVVTSHCYKCGESFDNIKILATYYGLDVRSDFTEIIRRGAGEFLNMDIDFGGNSHNSDEVTFILKDIVESQKNLSAFIDSQGGKWRGLLLDTLLHFRCGFLEKWTHPKNIVAGKNLYFSRRIIVQTGSQNYNAILLNEDRNKFPKKSWKLNAGNKKLFGLDLLPLNPELIILVEGEVDAMSIWQATEGKVFVVAIGGISISKNCFADFLKFFGNVKKPRILIIPDNDVAGRDNAQKLRDKFVNNYFPAVFKFLVDGTDKCDANDILQKDGNDKLAEIINNIIADSQADFEQVEQQIAEDSQPVDVKSDFVMSDDLRRKIYFGGNTDLDNGRS